MSPPNDLLSRSVKMLALSKRLWLSGVRIKLDIGFFVAFPAKLDDVQPVPIILAFLYTTDYDEFVDETSKPKTGYFV